MISLLGCIDPIRCILLCGMFLAEMVALALLINIIREVSCEKKENHSEPDQRPCEVDNAAGHHIGLIGKLRHQLGAFGHRLRNACRLGFLGLRSCLPDFFKKRKDAAPLLGHPGKEKR